CPAPPPPALPSPAPRAPPGSAAPARTRAGSGGHPGAHPQPSAHSSSAPLSAFSRYTMVLRFWGPTSRPDLRQQEKLLMPVTGAVTPPARPVRSYGGLEG